MSCSNNPEELQDVCDYFNERKLNPKCVVCGRIMQSTQEIYAMQKVDDGGYGLVCMKHKCKCGKCGSCIQFKQDEEQIENFCKKGIHCDCMICKDMKECHLCKTPLDTTNVVKSQ